MLNFIKDHQIPNNSLLQPHPWECKCFQSCRLSLSFLKEFKKMPVINLILIFLDVRSQPLRHKVLLRKLAKENNNSKWQRATRDAKLKIKNWMKLVLMILITKLMMKMELFKDLTIRDFKWSSLKVWRNVANLNFKFSLVKATQRKEREII